MDILIQCKSRKYKRDVSGDGDGDGDDEGERREERGHGSPTIRMVLHISAGKCGWRVFGVKCKSPRGIS